MPNWKKVIVSGSSAEITTLKLTGTSGQSSEGTSLMINSSGVVGTRELGSNAFNSNTYNNYSLPLAASGTRGGVKIGFTEEGKNYPVELSSEKMYVNVPWTDNNTTYSVGDGGLTQKNFTSTLKTKLDGIATGATNTSAPFYTSAISVGDGGLTQKNFTSTLKTKLDGIAASANNFSIAVSINEGEGVAVSSGGTQDFSAGSNVTLTQAVGGAIEISSTDNNTTYSVGDGGLTQKNFTSTLKTKLDGIATSATNVTNNNQIDNGAGYITSFTNTTYLLKATQYDGGNTDPYIKLDANSGTDDYIQLRGSGATSITRDDDGQITISSTDTNTNTTYTAGDGLDSSGTTFTHGNTSGQSSVNNSGNTVVQDVSLDEYGHVTGMVSATLDIPSNNNQLDNGEGFTTNTGTVTGTGSSNRIARWSSSTNISSVSDLTFDGVTLVAGSDGQTGGRVRTGDGSTSAPAFSFVGDTNTGFYSSTTDTIAATTGGTQRLTINSNGMKVNNGALGVNVNANSTDGRIDASNDIVAYSSDKRLKENIKVIETPLDKLDKLSGFTYNWNEKANKIAGFDKEESMVGVFAQDVESVLPEAVKRAPFDNDGEDGSKSGENYLTVQYEKLVPLLIESIKELKSEIEELKRGK